jgi:hypothetical protein
MQGERESLLSTHLTLSTYAPQQCDCGAGRLVRLEERPPRPVGNAEVSPSHTAPVLVRSLGVRSFLLPFFGAYYPEKRTEVSF